jgi:hypothetical protein
VRIAAWAFVCLCEGLTPSLSTRFAGEQRVSILMIGHRTSSEGGHHGAHGR